MHLKIQEVILFIERIEIIILDTCFPAARSLSDGENAHCTIRPGVWWEKMLQPILLDYPDVKYCFLVEYFYIDVVEKKRIFQVLSNFNDVSDSIRLGPPVKSILEKKWLQVN